ncbi:FAD-dependent oxidoreductase [Chitinibacteraceae bacterium HSL-7]
MLPVHSDIVVVGGGPAGAALALRLANAGRQVTVLEARQGPVNDRRALALSYASRMQLEDVGLWHAAALQPTPMQRVHVSQQHTIGRTELNAAELNVPALGYVVGYAPLANLALEQLARSTATLIRGARVEGIRQTSRYAVLHVCHDDQQHTMTARLVVLADGGKLVDALPDIEQTVRPYEQHAIVATVTPDAPHQYTAYERFAEDGPLALLPTGDDFTLVWTQAPSAAASRLTLDDAAFLTEVNRRFGGRVPAFTAVRDRASFPLALKTVDRVAARRVVLIGNAAQTLHPVAGQGLNLGLRDAGTLAELLLATPAQEAGEPETLLRYITLRERDAGLVTGFTDCLIRFFDTPDPALTHGRSLGLIALDQIAPVRRKFTRAMIFGVR